MNEKEWNKIIDKIYDIGFFVVRQGRKWVIANYNNDNSFNSKPLTKPMTKEQIKIWIEGFIKGMKYS